MHIFCPGMIALVKEHEASEKVNIKQLFHAVIMNKVRHECQYCAAISHSYQLSSPRIQKSHKEIAEMFSADEAEEHLCYFFAAIFVSVNIYTPYVSQADFSQPHAARAPEKGGLRLCIKLEVAGISLHSPATIGHDVRLTCN